MSQQIGAEEFPTNAEIDAAIRERKLDKVLAQKVRLEHQRRVFRARRESAVAEHPTLSRLGSPISAIQNMSNTQFLGLPATIAAGATAPITAARRDIGLGEAYELNRDLTKEALSARPVPQIVGTLAGFIGPFGKGSPAQLVSNLGFRAAGGMKLAQIAASSNRSAVAAAAQLGSALAGSAGAITAVNAAQVITNERPLVSLVADSIGMTLSPTNLAVSGTIGAATAIARVKPNKALLDLVDTARKRLPNFWPTPDMLREDKGFVHGLVDSLSVSAPGRRAVTRYMREAYFDPLKTAVNDLRRAINPRAVRGDITRAAARDIRSVLESPKQGAEGILGTQIERAGRAGFQAAEQQGARVGINELGGLMKTLRQLNERAARARGTEGRRGAEFRSAVSDGGAFGSMRSLIREAHRAFKEGRENFVTPQMLDNIRQKVGDIAKFDASRLGESRVISRRDVRDAKVLYRAIRETLRRSSPDIDRALTEIADLRRVYTAFKPLSDLAKTGDDIALVRGMFGAKDFERRWKATQQVLTAVQVQRIRGAYFAEFFEEVALRQGVRKTGDFALNARKVDDLFRGKGDARFRRVVFDSVLPGVRHEIMDLADVSDLVLKNVGKHEGSATARRMSDYALVVGAMDTIGLAHAALSDPGLTQKLVGRLLGAAGVVGFTNSLVNGRIAADLNRLASGQPLSAGQTVPAALMQAGGGYEIGTNLAEGAASGIADLMQGGSPSTP